MAKKQSITGMIVNLDDLFIIVSVIVLFFDFDGKENANERNESLLSNCRVQLFFCKGKTIIRNESEIIVHRLLRMLISNIFTIERNKNSI